MQQQQITCAHSARGGGADLQARNSAVASPYPGRDSEKKKRWAQKSEDGIGVVASAQRHTALLLVEDDPQHGDRDEGGVGVEVWDGRVLFLLDDQLAASQPAGSEQRPATSGQRRGGGGPGLAYRWRLCG